jgi:hypothetical protein
MAFNSRLTDASETKYFFSSVKCTASFLLGKMHFFS